MGVNVPEHIFPDTSHLRKCLYDPLAFTLDVWFENAAYRYFTVPPEEFRALTADRHPGSYLMRAIRPNYKALRLQCGKCGKAVEPKALQVETAPNGKMVAYHSACVESPLKR